MGCPFAASVVCFARTTRAWRASQKYQQIHMIIKDRCLLFRYSGNPLEPKPATEETPETPGEIVVIRSSAGSNGHHA
jgi:hypothetical protein